MGLFELFSESQDMGIDLGTANTLIYMPGKDIVLDEPSVIAIDEQTKEAIAVGKEAQRMLGRTPKNVRTIRPLKDGVITDVKETEMMLKEFIKKVRGNSNLTRSRIIIGVPSGITSVERRAIEEAMETSGAIDNIEFIDEPVAAAIGAGLPVDEPVGSMIVDIGGGTTDVAVLSLQGIVLSDSVRIAGDEITESIKRHLKRNYNVIVGERSAEQLKTEIGSAYPMDDEPQGMEIRGLNVVSGLPKTVNITTVEIRECIADTVGLIVDAIKKTLEQTPPELAGDIIDRGIMLAGGGALLRGLDSLIANETGIITHVAPNPLRCVVYGTGKVLEEYERLNRSSRKK
ncbi:rod shape-determining protein [Cyanobacterium aponinum UTEX 3222]|uniref:Cell shape-determining protein MreB n=3 Tax=Cyanobacterium aponinum TaxID=379064 RepID=K9Z8E9_CYAAP|nr:rod shape-determining protein [Cyanobacterium aponinum]WRL42547.1 rod shape-determining protein [Cyanobacterium aponinum UTEX 3222]AFZ55429.1 rod shape-determining protein MreB [Cyanobacterium aponinum PCC 10605]MBD2394395.1 rod shape-determining protein [Cyanobacterium aponinum FACHB-4101]MTF40097.1 MreB/Mrl family cell shape determining protein [Cyanobacterium aponinum 0216]PHV63270.1 rod shape-determining protein [Cyanobacterium aponinum IPPAS B-1201]